jgi:pyruvate/2-oxoglutarate/acetoin dehydrogenase E1 component
MALRGLRPVVEIMFADFTTLIADQLINHAARLRGMYHDQVRVPLVVRTPAGGRRGYGPTHSQSLEKLFLGVPGIQVVAPSHFGNPAALLAECILKQDDPVLFIEHKLLYGLPVMAGGMDDLEADSPNISAAFPIYRLRLRGAPTPALTLAAYGYMAELARQAMVQLAYEHEIFCELVVPTQLSPFELSAIIESVRRTGRLLTVEEGTRTLGWGAEVIARVVAMPGLSLLAVDRVAARDLTIGAASTLEPGILPGVDNIIQTCKKMV